MLGLKLNHVSKRGHWMQIAYPSVVDAIHHTRLFSESLFCSCRMQVMHVVCVYACVCASIHQSPTPTIVWIGGFENSPTEIMWSPALVSLFVCPSSVCPSSVRPLSACLLVWKIISTDLNEWYVWGDTRKDWQHCRSVPDQYLDPGVI